MNNVTLRTLLRYPVSWRCEMFYGKKKWKYIKLQVYQCKICARYNYYPECIKRYSLLKTTRAIRDALRK